MQIGDKVLLHNGADSSPINAAVEAIHENGSIDAKITQREHPAQGMVTHVLAGNFGAVESKEEFTTKIAEPSKTIRLDDYTTVTR
jgi:hypothetical protein